ncbi:hypothetical protein SAMN05421671_4743 [Pimelobacter simplex]|nr:hypothetical protein SAMN05421671_4743 [Pimelobacter simplex]
MRSGRQPARGSSPRRAWLVGFLAIVLSLLLVTPSSSAPGDPLPGDNDLPKRDTIASGANGMVTNSQGAVVRRSKMYLTLPEKTPIWGVLYTFLFDTPVENPVSYKPMCNSRNPFCLPDPFYQPACATADLSTQRRGGYFRSLLYPAKLLESGGAEIGTMAVMKVNLPAFGAIPATATITLRVPRVNGKVRPLTIHVWDVRQGGCDPDFVDMSYTVAEGQVEISISDLRVDGVPVKLGASCRTVRPADLWLYSEKGGRYYPGSGGPLGSYEGLSGGSLKPLDSPYYFKLNGQSIPPSKGLTIPPFTGCGVDEDLSPLVTAMASGPDNPLRVVQSPLATHGLHSPLEDPYSCDHTTPTNCVWPPPNPPARPPLPAGDE